MNKEPTEVGGRYHAWLHHSGEKVKQREKRSKSSAQKETGKKNTPSSTPTVLETVQPVA
jgi:NADH:ubiquinone oxidoreductase subunit